MKLKPIDKEEMEHLDKKSRDVLHDRYNIGLTYKEIAKKQGVSLNAIKKRLFRAHRKLDFDWTYLKGE